MAICTPNCSEAQIRAILCLVKERNHFKRWFEFFILLDCDIEFTDNKAAEGSYITANKIIVSPPQLGNIIKPTTSKLILSAGKPGSNIRNKRLTFKTRIRPYYFQAY